MASSDSEEFESADEDYEREIKTNKKILSSNSTIKTSVDVNTSNKKVIDSESKISSINSDLVKNNDNEPKSEINQIQSKSDEIQSKIADKIDEKDDWEFDDDWENTDELKPENHASQQIKEKTEAPKDLDGWEAFDGDEWIDNTEKPIETKKQDKPSATTFPISKDLSPSPSEPFRESKVDRQATITPQNSQDSGNSNNNNTASSSSWGGWKPWGGVVSSVFTAATEGVSSLTTHVSQVIENSIGVPDPEELVKINKEIEKSRKADGQSNVESEKNETLLPTFGNLVTGVTSIGNKVISGGLDTLEGIGKKTMNMLQENDPLLINKRKLIGLENDRPILSQVLREAKLKSEEVEKNLKQMKKQSYKKQLHFGSLFDHYYGLVHLEALEMLSKQSSIKLQSLLDPLSGKALAELNETLNEVSELCDLADLENEDAEEPLTCEILEQKLNTAIEDLGISINFTEILSCWKRNLDLIDEDSNLESQAVYENGLRCLAETCALQMKKMHKIAELLIIKDHHSTANEADSLVQMTTIFCHHLHGIANKFGNKLNTFQQTEELSSLITNIFMEVYNSTTYVQSAFKLFIPILQIGAA